MKKVKTMKAAVYRTFGGPIRVENDVPIPKTPSDGVLLEVHATGVCRSDWHGWKGHDGDIHAHGLPFVPGHELSGVVVQRGNDVRNIQIGDRVAVPFILSCGSCRYCLGSPKRYNDNPEQPNQSYQKGQPTICAQQKQPGFTQWGSFAEFVSIPRADRNLCVLPNNVSFVQAAALGCRFTTAYRAVYQQGELQAGQSIAIFGCGGLGLSCVMLAVAAGATTIVAIDVSEAALAKAKSLGATHTFHVARKNESPEQTARKMIHMLESSNCHTGMDKKFNTIQDGVDLSLDAAGFVTTSEAAVYATRPGGRMVQVGLPHGDVRIPMARIAGKEIHIVGSHGFDANVLPDLLKLVSTVDPCKLVQKEVTLEEGCAALEAMDQESPLGMTMITKFQKSTGNGSRL